MGELYITDLCEDKISVDHRVVKEMEILRTEHRLKLCFKPLYMLDTTDLKIISISKMFEKTSIMLVLKF